MNESVLRNGHWVFEEFKQRMTAKEWRQILLSENDRIIVSGVIRQLKGRNMGLGVIEVYKEPEKGRD